MNEIALDDRLAGIDLRELRALLAVIEERSFRGAARRLGYAQSAVSHQIAGLEAALGTRLVERPGGRHPVDATAAGHAAAAHARRILAAARALGAEVDALAAGERGRVRVGVFQTAAAFLLADPLGAFHRARPEVELELVEGNGRDLIDRVVAGGLDLAFGFVEEVDPAEVDARVLVDDPWVLLTRADGRFAGYEDVRADELDRLPLVAWEPGVGGQDILDEALRRLGVAPTVVFRTNDNVALTRFVAAGIGHALIGALFATSLRDDELVALPLDAVAPRRIAICSSRRRSLSAAARALVAEITARHAA